MRLNRVVLFCAAVVGLPMVCVPGEGSDISGRWARGDGNAIVRIAACGTSICAVNTWIKPGTLKEKIGDKLIMDIRAGRNGYSGTAFDPQRNLTYRLTVTIAGDLMTTSGCIFYGTICKAVSWARLR